MRREEVQGRTRWIVSQARKGRDPVDGEQREEFEHVPVLRNPRRAPKCDGRHVVFGEVVSGMEVASAIESVASLDGVE